MASTGIDRKKGRATTAAPQGGGTPVMNKNKGRPEPRPTADQQAERFAESVGAAPGRQTWFGIASGRRPSKAT